MKKNSLTTLEKLVIIIDNKQKYLDSLMAKGANRYSASILFEEIKYLKSEILPIVQKHTEGIEL